jgi:hypothetical protein
MNRYRNNLVYDSGTGEIKDSCNHMSMLEDFWIPRREGGRGTEITTLPGGQNLGEMEDVEYLLRKLYRALNVPLTRAEVQTGFNLGRSSEITRDEVKFYKFIERLRSKFSYLFMDILKKQCILKGIMTADDWSVIYHDVRFDYSKDSYFTELKENEILRADQAKKDKEIDELKAREQAESERIATEKAETGKLEKGKKYQAFLAKNGYNEQTKDLYHIKADVNKMRLYRLVDTFDI